MGAYSGKVFAYFPFPDPVTLNNWLAMIQCKKDKISSATLLTENITLNPEGKSLKI
jgi:hypothetical protein